MSTCYVYIITNSRNRVLYIGRTNNIERRMREHESGTPGSFSKRYNLHKLVYLETCTSIRDAVAREKQLKNWHRAWKLNLIRQQNPDMADLRTPGRRQSPEIQKQVWDGGLSRGRGASPVGGQVS